MKIIAHRGLSSKAPENTIPAFELAGQQQRYFGIECDIRMTKDNKFVVFHDEDLSRMAKIKRNIKDLTLEELQAFPMKKGSKIKSYPELFIPTIETYLDICAFYQKAAVIEIKEVHEMTMLTDLMDILDQYIGMHKIIISFNLNYLKYLRALSQIELQFLTGKPTEEELYDCRVNQIDVSIHRDHIKKNLVSRLRKEGMKIGVYTVNDQKEALKLEAMKVTYLTTDK